ncbi:Carbonyl reductase family member 4 [Lamellibrachia satsuma]|nr:Carbonyl reductase family member 4 [Lamellibrachia satsuma]
MKTCVVFGGTRGIGASIANCFFNHQYNVAVFSRHQEHVTKFLDCYKHKDPKTLHIGDQAQLVGFVCDVTNGESVQEVINTVQKQLGPVNTLVNAAGINRDALLLQMKHNDMMAQINTNLVGTIHTCKAVLRSMMRNKTGCIINIGSVVGSTGNAGQCIYSATKAGLVGFSKSLAREVGSRGIRVNVIAPGFIKTDMTLETATEQLENTIPLRRFGETDEVADAALFLAKAKYITGQVLYVDGGLHTSF